jgi:FkbM family methyltransferase
MAPLKWMLRPLVPVFLGEILDARKALSRVSKRPWADAFSAAKRLAWEQSRLAILPQKLLPLSFVIDVGANQGQWIGSLLEFLPVPEVWIFEPNPEAMKACRGRIGTRPGVTFFDLALGEAPGQAELHVTASSDFASILPPRSDFLEAHYGKNAAHVVEKKQIPVVTLDSLFAEPRTVDLLKIDVQGFERAVLCGARRVLENTRAVLLEVNLQSHYAGDDTLPALWNQLANQGFSLWSLSPPFTGVDGKALWADALFLKSDS